MLSLLDTGTPACCSDRPIAQHPPSRQQLDLSSFHARGKWTLKTTRGDLGGLNDASDAPQELACVRGQKGKSSRPPWGSNPTTTRIKSLRSTD
ncbi:hypothetical protein Pcac1_g19066 [Phytophthora cactorum]|nr:hypothetical protein Pcac1_g19066 [Phytophthora cactorum]